MDDQKRNVLIFGGVMLVMTVLTGVLIAATGKALVLEIDGISGKKEDSAGNYQENHVDGGRFKFYAE